MSGHTFFREMIQKGFTVSQIKGALEDGAYLATRKDLTQEDVEQAHEIAKLYDEYYKDKDDVKYEPKKGLSYRESLYANG